MEDILINRYMPAYQFSEYHEITGYGSLADYFTAAKQMDMAQSFLVKSLFWLRGLPVNDLRLPRFLQNMHFTYLDENAPKEFLIAFWLKPDSKGPVFIDDKEHFIKETDPWTQKVTWNFRFEKIEKGKIRMSTETRIFCLNKKAKKTFSIYWFFIRPFSGFIRKRMLAIIKNKVENI